MLEEHLIKFSVHLCLKEKKKTKRISITQQTVSDRNLQ